MKNYRKILLSAFIGSDNTGDNAILMSMVRQMKEQIPNAEISALSINTFKTEKLLGIQALSLKKYFKVLKAIAHTDIFVCGGGGILQDQTSVFNIPARLACTFCAILFRKKIIFYGIGAGPLNTVLGKILVRVAVSKAQAITVRDQESKNILLGLGINPEKIAVTGDPAINLLSCSEERINQIFKIENIPVGKPFIGVCLRHWFDTHYWIPVNIAQRYNLRPKGGKEKYDNFIKNITSCLTTILNRRDANVVFIPFWMGRDDKVHRDIIENIQNSKRVYEIRHSYTPDEILGIISKADIVLGMRLHSLILAATSNVPMIALNYTLKVENFMNAIGQRSMQIDVEDPDVEKLVDMIDQTLDNQSHIRNTLADEVKMLQYRELVNIQCLKELVNSLDKNE